MTLSARLPQPLPERDLAVEVASGSHAAFEMLMRRHNGRLFRVARAIVKNDAEAEDVLQDAYLQVYRRIGEFRGDSALGTWLTRIVVTQALMRLRKIGRAPVVVPIEAPGDGRPEVDVADRNAEAPDAAALRAEIRRRLERHIDNLPVTLRAVFVLREVEDLSVEETASCLAIPAATVRTRAFRARALLREALAKEIDRATTDIYAFGGARCDRIVAVVLARLPAPPVRRPDL